VRGLDTQAGQISGVITENGPIECDQVVLATGAWTRLFCGNMGIDFPQLKVIGSVMRTGPLAGAPEFAVAGSDFAFRKRLDGGYTIAQKNANVAQIVPDSFRLLRKFLPAFRSEGNEILLRFGRTFFQEAALAKRWDMSEQSPFERTRTLDPKPSDRILDQGLKNLTKAFPAFEKASIVEKWGCAIDVTPDAVPVISRVATHPGLLIASGFSGHGFGIGPGAGHLIADIVTDQKPIVDPGPYRLSRLVELG
jgi:glycine/D-amino acid oxidase-like deaminating enzyme